MLNIDGIVTTWNSGAQRITGYEAKEIIGKHFSCFYRPEDIKSGKPNRSLQVAAADGRYEKETLRVRKDGWQRANEALDGMGL
jgi:PAS domain S-box-containing protein